MYGVPLIVERFIRSLHDIGEKVIRVAGMLLEGGLEMLDKTLDEMRREAPDFHSGVVVSGYRAFTSLISAGGSPIRYPISLYIP
jgi:hypothetical protein